VGRTRHRHDESKEPTIEPEKDNSHTSDIGGTTQIGPIASARTGPGSSQSTDRSDEHDHEEPDEGAIGERERERGGRDSRFKGGIELTAYASGPFALGHAVLVILNDGHVYRYETFWDTTPPQDREMWEYLALKGGMWVNEELEKRKEVEFTAVEEICPHKGSMKAGKAVREAIDKGRGMIVAIEPFDKQSAVRRGRTRQLQCRTCGADARPGMLQQ